MIKAFELDPKTNRAAAYLARYEEIAAVSRRMLQAARAGLWDEVAALQQDYLRLVDGLEEIGTVKLDAGARVHRLQLLNRILDDDAALRDIADPQAARLATWLHLHRPLRGEEATDGTRKTP